MAAFVQLARSPRLPVLWLLLALFGGLGAALLPLSASFALFGVCGLLIMIAIEPRIGLLVMLVIAPLKALIDTESRIELPFDLGQLALVITLGAWLARAIAARQRPLLRLSPLYVPLIIFIVAASFSLWSAVSPATVLSELIKWIEMLAIVVMLVSLGGLGWIAAALMVAGVSQALIGIYQFAGGSGAPHLWILDFRFFRAFGGFGQPNPFGAFMGLSLAVALGTAWGTISRFLDLHPRRGESRIAATHNAAGIDSTSPRSAEGAIAPRNARLVAGLYALLALVGAAIIGAGLAVSWSRGAWLGFGAAALALLLFAPRRRWLGVVMVVLSVAALWFSIITGIAPDSLVARFTDFAQDLSGFADVRGQVINDQNYAVIERLAHWQAALGMADDAPWIGVGFGNYEVVYPRYALVNWPMALGHAHNYYLNLLAETGIVGLSAYLVAWGTIVALTLRALRRHTGLARGIALGLLGAWVHLAVHSLFDKLYVNNMFLHIGAMLGLIAVLLLPGRKSGQGTPAQSSDEAQLG